MNKKDKNISKKGLVLISFVLFFFFFSFYFISAQTPFEQTGGDLDIEYSKIQTIKQNTDHHFHFQLSNQTSLLSNETAQCQFTLTKPDGFVQYRNLDVPFHTGTENEFGLNVTKENFTELGTFSFVTQCFTDTETGFSSNKLFVTPSGESGTENTVFFIFIILLLYGITFTGFFGKNIPITILGGMAMLFLGIYLVNQGIIIYRDTLTNYVAYLTIGIGGITSFWALLEQLEVI